MLYKTALTLGQAGCLFASECRGAFFEYLECWRCVHGVVIIAADGGAEQVVFALSLVELGEDEFFELGEVLVGVSWFLDRKSTRLNSSH